jgi:hypothetical protein
MSYMLVVQNCRMLPDCFNVAKFAIYEGALSVWKINCEGEVIELADGTVMNGKFDDARE